METIHLDTHAVVWLFTNDLDKFSKKALDLIEKSDLVISPMVVLELEFLHEIGRLKYNSEYIIKLLTKAIDLKVLEENFKSISLEAVENKWTGDPFDRIIVSNAAFNNAVLISKDKNILDNYDKAMW